VTKRRVYDSDRHVHFVTFSCYKRRRLLDSDRAKRITIGHLGSTLAKLNGICLGFVIMPDHVHAMVWFPETEQLSRFMNHWKTASSISIKKLYREAFSSYETISGPDDRIWQERYYGLNLWSRGKVEQKLDYMHLNPLRAGLVEKPEAYPFSSARWYLLNKSVGVPIRWPDGLEADG